MLGSRWLSLVPLAGPACRGCLRGRLPCPGTRSTRFRWPQGAAGRKGMRNTASRAPPRPRSGLTPRLGHAASRPRRVSATPRLGHAALSATPPPCGALRHVRARVLGNVRVLGHPRALQHVCARALGYVGVLGHACVFPGHARSPPRVLSTTRALHHACSPPHALSTTRALRHVCARVLGNARVLGHPRVLGHARALRHADVRGHACVLGHPRALRHACARALGHACVFGCAGVFPATRGLSATRAFSATRVRAPLGHACS